MLACARIRTQDLRLDQLLLYQLLMKTQLGD